MDASFENITQAVEGLRNILPHNFVPEIGIICGSGLSALEQAITGPRYEVPYSKIKGFPVSTVPGHAGILVFGCLGVSHKPTVLMNGRAHYYEGHELKASTFPIRVMCLLGIKTCIGKTKATVLGRLTADPKVTNAAGGLDPSYKVGDVVVIQDHINFPGLAGVSPLRGPNLDAFGPRFIALSDAYDLELRRVAHLAWKEISKGQPKKMAMHEGVYAFVGGPNYETRAECRMLAKLGADLVGMSTVPEIIVARHCGVRVLALSLVTNAVVLEAGPRGDDPRLAGVGGDELLTVLGVGKANHEEVLATSKSAADEIKRLVVKIVEMETQAK